MQGRVFPVLVLFAFASVSAACCSTSPPPSDFGSIPVTTVISSVGDAVLDSVLTDSLSKNKLRITAVKLVLQLEDSRAGEANVAIVATAGGSITRSTTKQLTLQFSIPDERKVLPFGELKSLMVEPTGEPAINTKELVDAIGAAVAGIQAGERMKEVLKLGETEFEYEVDFALERKLSGGVDVKISSAGLTAKMTMTRKTGNEVIITFEPLR